MARKRGAKARDLKIRGFTGLRLRDGTDVTPHGFHRMGVTGAHAAARALAARHGQAVELWQLSLGRRATVHVFENI